MPYPDHVNSSDFYQQEELTACDQCKETIKTEDCLTLFPENYEKEVFCDQACHDTYVEKHALKVVQDFYEFIDLTTL